MNFQVAKISIYSLLRKLQSCLFFQKRIGWLAFENLVPAFHNSFYPGPQDKKLFVAIGAEIKTIFPLESSPAIPESYSAFSTANCESYKRL